MGEEAYEETVLAADCGTLTIRGSYGRKTVYLGIAEGNKPDEQPDVMIELTPLMTRKLGEELGAMTAGALDNTLDALREVTEIAMNAFDQISDRTKDPQTQSVAREAFDAVDSIQASVLNDPE